MDCLKCGKKTEGTNVFCGECLADMARYPVKPGTPAPIPVRTETPDRKPPRAKKERPPEEQIASLHRLVQALAIWVACLVTTLAVIFGVLVYMLVEALVPEPQQVPTGRNYSITVPSDGD